MTICVIKNENKSSLLRQFRNFEICFSIYTIRINFGEKSEKVDTLIFAQFFYGFFFGKGDTVEVRFPYNTIIT